MCQKADWEKGHSKTCASGHTPADLETGNSEGDLMRPRSDRARNFYFPPPDDRRQDEDLVTQGHAHPKRDPRP